MFKKVTFFFTLCTALLYSSDPSLEQFLHQLKLPAQIEQRSEDSDLTNVGFNSEIFFSIDEEGNKRAVIKKCPGSSELIKESKALQFLYHTPCEHVTAPKVLGIFKGESNYLTMETARGSSMSELTQRAAKGDATDFTTLLKATKKMAQGFSELHQKTSFYKRKVAPSYLEQQKLVEEGFLRLVRNERSIPLSVRKMQKKLKTLKSAAEREKLQAAIIHGDPHPGNLFVDEESEKLIMIDLLEMAPSMQRDRGGPLARDMIYARNFLKMEAKYCGLSKSQVKELMETFDANYQIKIPESVYNYYTFLFHADLVHSFHTFDSGNIDLDAQAQFFYRTSLKNL